MSSHEQSAVKKSFRRLIPLLMVCYFVAYLDRANVGFAALHMSEDIGLTAAAFGLGAGLFFITYFIFEIPSNLMLSRIGARRWIARIMLTWGVMSGAMALVTDEYGFYTLRLLLGAAEAGFFPGITYFVTLWFPARYRARVMGAFLCAAPISLSIGAPISGALLGLDGVLGIAGWRWMFFLEALPAVILAFVVLRCLTDRPSEAHWLSLEQRTALTAQLAIDAANCPPGHGNFLASLFSTRVLLLGVANFSIVVASYGVSFFLPRIVKDFGLNDLQTGLLSAVPYATAAIAMIIWGRRSDNRMERRFHTAAPIVFASLGLVAAAMLSDPVSRMLAFTCAAVGCWAAMSPFWSLCFSHIPNRTAAGSIAVINAIANLGGFTGPSIMGFFRDRTGDFTAGLLVLAAINIVAVLIVCSIDRSSSQVSEQGNPRSLPQ